MTLSPAVSAVFLACACSASRVASVSPTAAYFSSRRKNAWPPKPRLSAEERGTQPPLPSARGRALVGASVIPQITVCRGRGHQPKVSHLLGTPPVCSCTFLGAESRFWPDAVQKCKRLKLNNFCIASCQGRPDGSLPTIFFQRMVLGFHQTWGVFKRVCESISKEMEMFYIY